VESGGVSLTGEQFERFRSLVRTHSGIALRDEKRQLVCSRLSKRLRELGISSFDEYYKLVQQRDPHGEELQRLLNAITTNKTSFFREEHHFDLLRTDVLAPLASGRRPVRLRVWSAGSSTGEEAYSALMTICSALPQWAESDIRLLASDLDTNVLRVGERAVYRDERLDEIPDELRRRWIIRGADAKEGFIRVRRELRALAAFRQINFVSESWPVKTKFDVIFCRNALIYFDGATQKQIVDRLLRYLSPNGLLFLGHSESMAGVRPDLVSLGRTAYRYVEPHT